MSNSPQEKDVDQNAQSGEDQGPDMDTAEAQGAIADFEVKEQDRWLPIANVARIMKMALPDNAKIAKEAKECMQECVSEFISFITSEASEKCQQEKRKTVNGEDILFAMTSLGFENYAEALKIYLSKYRERSSSEHPTDWDETQSTRGENQGRPSSSAGYPGVAGANATSSGQSENANSLLSPEQDGNAAYGYPSDVTAGHNGIGGDNY